MAFCPELIVHLVIYKSKEFNKHLTEWSLVDNTYLVKHAIAQTLIGIDLFRKHTDRTEFREICDDISKHISYWWIISLSITSWFNVFLPKLSSDHFVCISFVIPHSTLY